MGVNAEQHMYLLNSLRSTRIATRRLGGKNLSYLEAWDVKAHLTRIFGFGNWDSELLRERYLGAKEYTSSGDNPKPMVEVAWQATVQLTIRNPQGSEICRYSEAAVGSATGGADGAGLGDLHDNALKQAESDALKRCAINLGTQFGLSLYDNGAKHDVVRNVLESAWPTGTKELMEQRQQPSTEAQQALNDRLGGPTVTPTGEGTSEGGLSDEDVSQQMGDGTDGQGQDSMGGPS